MGWDLWSMASVRHRVTNVGLSSSSDSSTLFETDIFKLWYTIRAVLPCSARAFAPIRTVLRNLFCFWTLCEMTALLCKIPFVTSLVLKHANISAVVSGLVMVVLLTGYDRSGDGVSRSSQCSKVPEISSATDTLISCQASYRLLVALLRPIM